MKLRKKVVALTLSGAAALGLGVAVASPAAALSQITGPFACTTNTYVYIKSTTTGATTHISSDGRSWYKGTFSVATAATTATQRSVLTFVQVNGTTIQSSTGVCA